MAEMRSAAQQTNMANWAQETKSKARELRGSACSVARSLFQSGDLREFLDLLCRMNYYDAYNLLLIYQQYPKATCLSGFKLWQKLLGDPTAQVLKPEWRGKGIDLIAPYTDYFGNGSLTLTWFAVKQFDISQTNVKNFSPPPSPYIPGEDHLPRLLKSIADAISSEYHRSVVRISSSAHLRSTSSAGEMGEEVIQVRTDISPERRLRFLCECMSLLAMEPLSALNPSQKEIASQYIVYCLLQTWGMEPPAFPPQNRTVLASIPPEHQVPFLSLIQRTVRALDESVSFSYQALSREEQERNPSPL